VQQALTDATQTDASVTALGCAPRNWRLGTTYRLHGGATEWGGEHG
jgi:hypothetical protein